VNKHPDSFLEPAVLGAQFPLYKPTFAFPGEYIDNFHTLIGSSAKIGSLVNLNDTFGTPIKGKLRREDALKLYEIAYFVEGDILELGSYHGLSTCILSQANHNSAFRKRIYSVDLDIEMCSKTMKSLQAAGLNHDIETICSDAAAAVQRLAGIGKRFEFVFIDHSHSYQPVQQVCKLLPMIVNPDGFCLFHDFNDPRNEDPAYPQYGVYRAVVDNLDPDSFEFYGMYGCTGLYRSRY